MAQFNPQSRVVEVHGNDGSAPFFVHGNFLRQPFGGYGAMIDHALTTTGQASIRLNLSHGALTEWTKWLYGTRMGDANTETLDVWYLAPLLELYEHSHTQFRPEVDHKCANACLDAMLATLEHHLESSEDIKIFGSNSVPSFVNFVTTLDKCNGKGTQMLVDLIVHGNLGPLIVSDMIQMIEPIPALADFFRKMSYALAIAITHDFDMLAPEHMRLEKDDLPKIPNLDSPHAYHSRKEDEALCCGRQAPPPAFVPGFAPAPGFVPAPGFAPAPGFMPAPAFVPAPAFAPAPMKPER